MTDQKEAASLPWSGSDTAEGTERDGGASASRDPAQKTRRGRPFQPGNPGRPKGTRRRTTVLAEALMAENAEGVIRAVIGAASQGDMAAARIVMDRICPVRRGRPVAFPLPDAMGPAGLVEAFTSLTKAVSGAVLTPEEAASVAAVLEAQRRAIETADLAARVTALEAQSEEQARARP